MPGNRLGDVSHAVQTRVEADGFSVIRSLVGHGIGRAMHEDPQIPNFGEPGTGPELEEGMVLAIEPMVNVGTHHVRMGSDNWAVYSEDGSLAAHFEHTVAITGDGPRILTPWHLSEAADRCRLLLFPVGAEPSPGLPRRSSFVRYVSPVLRSYEGPRVSQAHVREVQDHPPRRCGPRDLSEPPSQAASGVTRG